MKNNITIGIDLAKRIMHWVQVDSDGKKSNPKKVKRADFLSEIAKFPKEYTIAMEACSGCNYWAQEISKLGFKVKLMKTKDVKVYAQSRQKNDFNDALATAKASLDQELKTVRPKNKAEQEVHLLHRIRENTIRDRVQKTNSLMSSLEEFGYVSDLRKSRFCKECEWEVRAAKAGGFISEKSCSIMLGECEEILALCKKELLLDKAIKDSNKGDEKAKRLLTIHGIGPINASYLSVSPAECYDDPKDFAASLGLVPRQYTSGDKISLGSITKQGDRYARKMLIQAARTIAIRAKIVKNPEDKLQQWAQKKFSENKPFNVICVGLANKLARIVHSVIMNQSEYKAA